MVFVVISRVKYIKYGWWRGWGMVF